MDADSLNPENHLEEGAFYVWTKPQLQEIIKDDFELFSIVFNINDFGLWENDNYVLIQDKSLYEIALKNGISEENLQEEKQLWEKMLYNVREKRSKPRLDDKCLCSWNAIMLKAYVDGYKALQDEHYLKIALQNATFIQDKFLADEGNLFHNYKNGTTTINGYLEDYCFVIDAFIALYQVTLDENWLQTSKQLTDYCLDKFYDEKTQFFRFTSTNDDELITTHFEIEDNVIPASNSVMANNLIVLSKYFGNSHYEKLVENMLHHVIENIDYPSAFSNWLQVLLQFTEESKELAIAGNEAPAYVKKLNAIYIPNILIAGATKNSNLPILESRFETNKTLFYLCKNRTCALPTSDYEQIITVI